MNNKSIYNKIYHNKDISKSTFLITGGAGFIGSNIVEYLIINNAKKVRVLDNLSNGYFDNIKDYIGLPNFEFIEGDIRDIDTCRESIKGIDFVSHQAALGSVPRSIKDPITTNQVNIDGFLNMMEVVKESNHVKRFVYAASSSTYGDSQILPKIEEEIGSPLSPYAVTKLVNEIYADVFSKVYNLHTIGLRYFNVFGPRQNPNNPYAAVLPLFCKHFKNDTSPCINGDGNTSRDFTFVENVVQANIKSLMKEDLKTHRVYNIACGNRVSLNDVIKILNKISSKAIRPRYTSERIGDIKHSEASIKRANLELNYFPNINFDEGIEILYNYILRND